MGKTIVIMIATGLVLGVLMGVIGGLLHLPPYLTGAIVGISVGIVGLFVRRRSQGMP